MIKFFRKIRQNLLQENRFSKYLLYAIGEIVLVVIGILIALQVNNWNEERKQNQIEKQLLNELIENLELNEQKISASISEEYKSIESVKKILIVLENQMDYHDSLDYHFARGQYSPDLVISSTAFHAIQNRGIHIISSDSLRKSIITLFDNDYGFLISETIRLENQFWPSALLPLFHKHFRINTMEGNPYNDGFSATPIDYEALLNDQEYHNMIKHRGSFRYQGAAFKENALKKTVELKNQIIAYLN